MSSLFNQTFFFPYHFPQNENFCPKSVLPQVFPGALTFIAIGNIRRDSVWPTWSGCVSQSPVGQGRHCSVVFAQGEQTSARPGLCAPHRDLCACVTVPSGGLAFWNFWFEQSKLLGKKCVCSFPWRLVAMTWSQRGRQDGWSVVFQVVLLACGDS